MLGFTMFVGEMCRRSVPSFIYALEWVCGIIVMAMLLTTRENRIFYTYIGIDESGPFPRQVLEYGIGFYFFVVYMVVVCVSCVIMCVLGSVSSKGIERKRMLCTAIAVSCPWLPNLIRMTGITGGYEIPCLGIMGAVVLVGMALIRYGYFDSIALAGENALSHGQEGIMVVDNRHIITYFNKRMEELFENLTLKQSIYENAILTDIYTGKIKNLDRQDRTYEMRVEPLLEGGHNQGYMIWVLDVTEHQKMLLSMEKKNEQLEEAKALAEEARKDAIAADEAKGRFLAYMSHEIRTPINAVLGMDTMILRETVDDKIKEYALDIQNAGKSLLSLINDILDFSKIESGKLEIIHVEYDFSSLIHDISNMLKAKAEKKKMKLYIYVDENLPSRMYGDDVRIRQVLVNLLNNAVKYTQEGSVTLRISGRTEEDKEVLDFSVEDTGIGIKKEDITKLFAEFQRIEEKRNRNVEGTGLGLNITARLLGLMDSKIQVESVYGKGSKFYFTLEQQIIDKTPVGNLEERIRKQSTEYEYNAAFIAPDAEILVVDDNIVNLKVFVSLLRQTKVHVDVADSGKACLNMIADKHYDLIFLDHMMPEMDGIEVLYRMKSQKNHKNVNTPVVALTANAITGATEMYLREGFDAFLSKPINPEKLEQLVLNLLPKELRKFEVMPEEIKKESIGNISDGKEVSEVFQKESTELPIIDGIDWNYGHIHLPSEELLLETVKDFCKAIPVEAKSLNRFYEGIREEMTMQGAQADFMNGKAGQNLQQYRIKVHAMKSSANMIGAIVLGGMAKILENAARDGDVETIEKVHGIFLREWLDYKEKLAELVSQSKSGYEERKGVEDYTIILAYLEMLRQALEELDIDEMDRIMELLNEFHYPEEMQAGMERLNALVVNMERDYAFEEIEELVKQANSYEEWRSEE